MSVFKEKKSFFGRLSEKIADAVMARAEVDEDLMDELEEILITSDIGMDTTMNVMTKLREKIKNDYITSPEGVTKALKAILTAAVDKAERQKLSDKVPLVILMIGINGGGKTTTIGKLAYQFKQAGKKVYLGAADTFRAAAVEQLCIWGERVGVTVIKQQMGSDPASVAFDTLSSAKANGADVVLIDTAGRLHNKVGLMNEL